MKKEILEVKKEKDETKGINISGGGTAWAENIWGTSWTYIRTVVDTAREPFLILDDKLCIIAANEAFYKVFGVKAEDTEKKYIFELGDGQWNIPTLKKLLENILPKDTFFKGFEVDHEFPEVGRKTLLLNARRIYQDAIYMSIDPLILLAIEDISEITMIAEKLASKTKEYEARMIERSEELEIRISELAYLNKTVVGFNIAIAGLASVVDTLKENIISLQK